MRTTIDLDALTERVLGVVPPRPMPRAGRRRRGEPTLAVAMLATSAAATLGSLALWSTGHGDAGLRVFCGSVLALALVLRLR